MSLRAQSEPIKASPVEKLASGPSIFEIDRHIRRSALPFNAKVLLGAILDHDRHGTSRFGCTASIETLASDIGASVRLVTKLLAVLEAGGWITMDRRTASKFSPRRVIRMGPSCTGCTPSTVVLGAHLARIDVHLAQTGDAPSTVVPGKEIEGPEERIEDFAPLPESESEGTTRRAAMPPTIHRAPAAEPVRKAPVTPLASPRQRYPEPSEDAEARRLKVTQARRLLDVLAGMGWRVVRVGDGLKNVRLNPMIPPAPLSGPLCDELRQRKPEILAMVGTEAG